MDKGSGREKSEDTNITSRSGSHGVVFGNSTFRTLRYEFVVDNEVPRSAMLPTTLLLLKCSIRGTFGAV